jgi:2-polyprenyl-6-hydroxyphenyl methylase/3-demethylubiquinone-9 3-methyltransferase
MSDTNFSYYAKQLSAERLQRVYEIASLRVQQYFAAEINFLLSKITPSDVVLELGCGYGRIIPTLAERAHFVVGIDTSIESLKFGKSFLQYYSNCLLLQMTAVQLDFLSHSFDVVVCIQNGISAFHVNQHDLIKESIRVTKPGGRIYFSSYSEKFWKHRLQWFRLQAQEGLVGEIDEEQTKNGVIVCKDGFTATTVDKKSFLDLTSNLNVNTNIVEVDESTIFCEMMVR